MSNKQLRKLKPFIYLIIFFFTWTNAGVFQLVHAATDDTPASKRISKIQRPKKVEAAEEKFQETLEWIREKADATNKKIKKGEDVSAEESEIKKKIVELEPLDVELRKKFKKTEEKIKGLPSEIQNRHKDFVNKYEKNLKELKSNIDALGKAKTTAEKEKAHSKLKDFLDKTKKPSKHIPLDPNKLPHRKAKPKFKKPRLKKEEFSPTLRAEEDLDKKLKPILVASIGALAGLLDGSSESYTTGSYLVAQAMNLPTAEDLAETTEIQFTDDIIAKAQELGNNSVKIYEYVKNNFVFEPYYGALKGSQETLLEKAGNDFDQASLLIALLRVSDIPARYAYGTVEIEIERVKKWLGVESETVAGEMLASNGIPASLIAEGGVISKVRFEHLWVEAYVPYGNYRGVAKDDSIKSWIPLDPGFKQLQYTPGPDLKTIMNFDATTFWNDLLTNSTYNSTDYFVSNVSDSFLKQKIEEYKANLDNYLTNNMPDAGLQDLVGSFDILYEKLGVLPSSLPYKVIVKGTHYSAVPSDLKHKLRIEIRGADPFGGGDLSYLSDISELVNKRMTVAYAPATTAEDNTLTSYGSVSATPAYLVTMKPVLMIDDVAAATGGEVGLGKFQQINLTFISPNLSTEMVSHRLTSGGYHALGINPQRISKTHLMKQTEKMQSMKTYIDSILSGNPSSPPAGDPRDNLIGDMLYDVTMNYFYNLDAMNYLLARVSGMVWVRQTSEAMAFLAFEISSMFGVPTTVKPTSMGIDVARNVVSPFSMSGDHNAEKAFNMQSGTFMSAMEHIIFERMFNVNAVSTIRVLQQVNALSIPTYIVTKENIEQVLPFLQVSSAVIAEIQNSVNAGMRVIVPQTEITLQDWSGSGCVIYDPQTFRGAYKISGGINGGSTVCLTEGNCYFNDTNPCTLPDSGTNPWGLLIDNIDHLLVLADLAFLGQVPLEGLASNICSLLQGIDPSAPGATTAQEILIQLTINVATMFVATGLTQVPLTWPSSATKLVTFFAELGIWFSTSGLMEIAFSNANIFQYSGYFAIHHLYVYMVLFRVGWIDSFSSFEY